MRSPEPNVLVALALALPPAGEPLTTERRKQWLYTAEKVLDYLYPPLLIVAADEGEAARAPASPSTVQEPLPVKPADPLRSEDAAREDASAAAPEPEKAAAAPPAGEESHEPVASPAPTLRPASASLKARLRDLHAEHPEYTADEAAAALDCSTGAIRGYSSTLKLKWANANEKRRQQQHAKLVEAIEAEKAAPPAPKPERPRRALPAAPKRPAARPGSTIIQKPIVHPKKTQFYLRDDAGLYLHFSGRKMIENKDWAWRGTHDQLLACRRTFVIATDLREQVVEKEKVAA